MFPSVLEACSWKLKVCLAVGVPETTPEAELRVIPEGSDPADTEYEVALSADTVSE
jgi:hypothetical protein